MTVSVFAVILGSMILSAYAGPVAFDPSRVLAVPAVKPSVIESADPYDFGYQSIDEQGTRKHHQEKSNGKVVKGSFGYLDPLGVYRTVKYVADEDGFRAVVSSNEPGMGTSSSADAVYNVQPPPPASLLWPNPQYVALKNNL